MLKRPDSRKVLRNGDQCRKLFTNRKTVWVYIVILLDQFLHFSEVLLINTELTGMTTCTRLHVLLSVGKGQKKCFGGDQKLHHTFPGKCGLSDQQSGNQFPQTAGPSAESASRNGI